MDQNSEMSSAMQDLMRSLGVEGEEEGSDTNLDEALRALLGNGTDEDIAMLLNSSNLQNNATTTVAEQAEAAPVTSTSSPDVLMEQEPTITTPSNASTFSSAHNPNRLRESLNARPLNTSAASRVAIPPSTTFGNIISELNPKNQARMQELLSLLQSDGIGIDNFMLECKKIVNARQYQEMEQIRDKVRKDRASARPSPAPSPAPSAPSSRRGSPGASPSSLQSPTLPNSRPNSLGKSKKRSVDSDTGETSAGMLLLADAAVKKQKLETMIPFIVPPPPHPIWQADIVLPSPIHASGASASNINSTPSTPGPSRSRAGVESTAGATSANNEKLDVDALTDVMGYAGIDLREEKELILRNDIQQLGAASGGSLVDRSHTQNFMNVDSLRLKTERITRRMGLCRPNNDVLNYLALAAQQRLQGLVQEMVAASKHRVFSQ
ncbi:transcription initiation factor TFIID component TAF4 family-domain-containing protein, partial [Syncephalis fuscata]